MAEKHGTGIAWTHGEGFRGETWNPVTGCSKVSPGCANCYAETISLRFGHSLKPWTPENAAENVVLHPDRLDQPLRWRRPRMVFVNSMSDLFHERIPYEFVRDVFNVMRRCDGGTVAATGKPDPSHTFQVLTKRPERALELLRDRRLGFSPEQWPAHVWIGVSIENARFTWRADVLREIPAAVRFISAEPLLGSLFEPAASEAPRMHDWQPILSNTASAELNPKPGAYHCPVCNAFSPFITLGLCSGPPGVRKTKRPLDLSGIDWLIVGGESGGRKARPMHPEWARELRDACLPSARQLASGVIVPSHPAFFFKQWGSWAPGDAETADLALYPDGRRSRDVRLGDGEWMRFAGAGPKSGGNLLDGREWQEFPRALQAVPA